MSRLDSVIRRLTAQRACLDRAAQMIAGLDGVVLEIGLGNGRTFDHLRETLPEREIFVFDRQVACHPDSRPDDRYLFLGELPEILVKAQAALPEPAILVHSDIGTGDPDHDKKVAEMMAETLPPMLQPGAIVLSDQYIPLPGATEIALPDGVREGRYFFQNYQGWQQPVRRSADTGR